MTTGSGAAIPSFVIKETKSGIQKNPQTTLYRKHNRLSIASSLNDIDPINKKIRPRISVPSTIAKLSKNFKASADGLFPKISHINISLKLALIRLKGKGSSCRNVMTATVLKIVFILILI